jgi:hypothetical protein
MPSLAMSSANFDFSRMTCAHDLAGPPDASNFQLTIYAPGPLPGN